MTFLLLTIAVISYPCMVRKEDSWHDILVVLKQNYKPDTTGVPSVWDFLCKLELIEQQGKPGYISCC